MGIITARVADWYTMDYKEVRIEDLEQWIDDHGKPVLVHPPTVNRPNVWLIFTSDTGRFGQR